MIEEIPNPENVEVRDEGSGAQGESDEKLDRTTIIFNNYSDLLFYFLHIIP